MDIVILSPIRRYEIQLGLNIFKLLYSIINLPEKSGNKPLVASPLPLIEKTKPQFTLQLYFLNM